jgi:hypothetical protein
MSGREHREYAFHRVDARDIPMNLVICAVLALEQAQPAPGVCIARSRAAQVYYGG